MMADVLIVGAGPTGLVLALELSRMGVPLRIVDKSSGSGEASRAMGVQARTLEFYAQLGIADEIVSRGIPMREIHLREAGEEIAAFSIGHFGEGLSPFPFILSLPQDEHEQILIERLREAGIAVEWNTELVALSDLGDRVRATLANGGGEETLEVAYLCGCDGAHSGVREALGLGFPGGTYEHTFFVADVEATGEAADGDINMCLGADTFCAVFPIRTSGMIRLVGLAPERRDDGAVTLSDVQPIVERLGGLRIERENWFSTYRVHHRVADRFQKGRVFIAGDAGHIHSPAGGQGMNTGIGDAVNLAWKLAATLQGRAEASILETYEVERLAFARLLVSTTDRLFRGLVARNWAGSLLRTVLIPRLVPLLMRFSFIRRAAFRAVSQIRIRYPQSALSEGEAGALRGGDRLPWVATSNNFAPLRSLEWQIHVYGTAAAPLRAFAETRGLPLTEFAWNDDAQAARLLLDALYLVRPDGYIAFASPMQNVSALEHYLDRFAIRAGR